MSKKAMIVEDDSVVREVLSLMLKDDGWEIVECESGDDVLQLTIKELPDVVILDIMLPGIDGFEAYAQLRGEVVTEHIPVIMLTSINDFELGKNYDADSVGERLSIEPPNVFLEKPVDRDTLLQAIASLIS